MFGFSNKKQAHPKADDLARSVFIVNERYTDNFQELKEKNGLPDIDPAIFQRSLLSLIYSSYRFSILSKTDTYQQEFVDKFLSLSNELSEINAGENIRYIDYFSARVNEILLGETNNKSQQIGELFTRACLSNSADDEKPFSFYEKHINVAVFGSNLFNSTTEKVVAAIKGN